VGYTRYTEDERGGFEVFREGDELDIGVSLEWRPEPWWAVVTVRDIYRFKAERINAAGQLTEEPENSNGNEIRGTVTVGYIIDDVWTVRGILDFRYVAANDYATTDALYDGGRFKIAIGPGVTWTFSRTFALDASVRYFYLDAERSPTFPLGASINGVHADMRVVYRF
jgi:long-subunit fatty acid transport protein